MKFREIIYLVGTSCFCGLVYLLVVFLLGIQSRSGTLTVPAVETINIHPGLKNVPASFSEPIVQQQNPGNRVAVETIPLIDFANVKALEDAYSRKNEPEITIAVVACGGKEKTVQQAITMIKSAIIFSKRNPLKIIGFADEITRELFTEKILDVLAQGQKYLHDSHRLSVEVRSTWFPPENANEWNQLYAPCSAQRLFFSSMLPNVDALLYLDTDTLILDDLSHLWNYFQLMSSSQYFGMVAEHELPGNGWYNMEASFPYFGKRGLNAGVMLMNLTRMRQVKFQDKMYLILLQHIGKLPWGDQDILNIFLHNRTENVYQLPCQFNYRLNHCACDYNDNKSCSCKSAIENGVSIFHGNKGVFFKNDNKSVIPSTFYDALRTYDLVNGTPKDLLQTLYKNLRQIPNISRKTKAIKNAPNSCTNLKTILLKHVLEIAVEYEIEDNDHEDRQDNNQNDAEQFLDFSLENKLEFIE